VPGAERQDESDSVVVHVATAVGDALARRNHQGVGRGHHRRRVEACLRPLIGRAARACDQWERREND
jgi:hypothetical protein